MTRQQHHDRDHQGRADADALRSDQLVDLICPILTGETPEAQGATLAQLIAMFIAGHPPELRDSNLTGLMECAKSMVPCFVEAMIARHQAPADWHGHGKH